MFGVTERIVSLLGIPQQIAGAAGLTAESDLTAAAKGVYKASAALTSESGLTAAAVVVKVASAALTAESELSAAGTRVVPVSSSLSAESDATAAAVRVVPATSPMSGESDLAATAKYIGVASSALTAQSDLTGDATRYAVVSAALTAESELSATATRVELGASIVVGTSDLTAVGTVVKVADVAMTATSDLTALGGLIINAGSAPLSGDVDLAAAATRVVPNAAASLMAELTVAPVTALPIYRLLDPTSEVVYTDILPFSRYGIDSGKTILINGTDLTLVEVPMMQELDAADFYFLGGHKYQLSQTEYEAFVACGRSDLVEVA